MYWCQDLRAQLTIAAASSALLTSLTFSAFRMPSAAGIVNPVDFVVVETGLSYLRYVLINKQDVILNKHKNKHIIDMFVIHEKVFFNLPISPSRVSTYCGASPHLLVFINLRSIYRNMRYSFEVLHHSLLTNIDNLTWFYNPRYGPLH